MTVGEVTSVGDSADKVSVSPKSSVGVSLGQFEKWEPSFPFSRGNRMNELRKGGFIPIYCSRRRGRINSRLFPICLHPLGD